MISRAAQVSRLARPDRLRMRRCFASTSRDAKPLEQIQKRQPVREEQSRTKRSLPSLRDPKSFKNDYTPRPPVQVTLSGTIDGARDATATDVSSGLEVLGDPGPTTTALRRNPVGVQLLSPSLHTQLFPGQRLPKPPQHVVDISLRHLSDHALSPESAAVLPEITFDLPPLQGRNIREHFHALGLGSAEPYLSMSRDFVGATLPEMPERWIVDRPGWIKYGEKGEWEAVEDLGEERMVVFDVETLYKLSSYPVMATAASPSAWYSWLSPSIFDPLLPGSLDPQAEDHRPSRPPKHHPHDLIPLFKKGKETQPRLVVGHNVGYDRARIAEEYDLDRTSTRFVDTLSLHVATRGITSVQRPAWLAHKKAKKQRDDEDSMVLEILTEAATENADREFVESLRDASQSIDEQSAMDQKKWEEVTSVNSLAEVAALHCGYPVDKSIRDRFGDDEITHASMLRDELPSLIGYCANDVKVTHDVYTKVFPLFLESCPHPATFAGVLSMGNSFLPVNESWERYIQAAEQKYRELEQGVKGSLRFLAEKLRREGKVDGDPWHEQMDWSPKKPRWSDEGEDAPQEAKEYALQFEGKGKGKGRDVEGMPKWYTDIHEKPESMTLPKFRNSTLPLLLRLEYMGYPLVNSVDHSWVFRVPRVELDSLPEKLRNRIVDESEDHALISLSARKGSRAKTPFSKTNAKLLSSSAYPVLLERILERDDVDGIEDRIMELVEDARGAGPEDVWAGQLDWSTTVASESADGMWPKWYWDLTGPASRLAPGELSLTIRQTITPLLLRLQWQSSPLFYHKDYKWLYRVRRSSSRTDRGAPIAFDVRDQSGPALDTSHQYYRLPHPEGEGKNVGSPLSRGFVKLVEAGEISSAAAEDGDVMAAEAARQATQLNVLSSYWISSRERIMNQMVVYESPEQGMILPQVIPMGTVTRRAVEATWLTASNAKKNRIGSELKAMVRAPPGYAIVGADVDSEELWISSVMGDSQFGMHGATAIGWMTLEGTKSAGTDLHSKTAGILGTSRDAAKVFNYSRIYGAGQRHAVQLLMQGDPSLSKQTASEKARSLYEATKGAKSTRSLDKPPAAVPSLWHGGSESFLFNTLEAIALSERPTTPALGCGVTKALSRLYLEERSSYLPSRINWVVQSSGVDYLHLLIVSMEYLLKTYDIKARYLISVHDEVRYLAKEEHRYRCALALQIANAWTRALFCYNLGIDDVPQGVLFFSAVDVDHVLRKEVFMTCETPSHPYPIPAGESLDIQQLLDITQGHLGTARSPSPHHAPETKKMSGLEADGGPPVSLFPDIRSPAHQRFLNAQAQSRGLYAKMWLDRLPPMFDQFGAPLPSSQDYRDAKRKPTSKRKSAAKAGRADKEADQARGDGGRAEGWNEEEWAEVDIAKSVSPLFAGRRVEVAPTAA